jgi:hypothetical protein
MNMDSAAFPAAISGAVAIIVAALTAGATYLLTKRREREAEWRKMKLDLYKEYVAALSGIVEGRDTEEGHIRYVDAVNTLTLVASPPVLKALYAYLDYSTSRNVNKTIERHDEILTNLINTLRRDVYPDAHRGGHSQTFRLITVPPDMRSSRSLRQEK